MSSRTVHPRWVWGGVTVALLGAALLGWGIMILSVLVSVIGAVVLIFGAGMSLAGGVLYDAVPFMSAGTQLEQVVHADVHTGVAPGEQISDPDARQDARQTADSAEAVLHRPAGPPPALAPVAGWTLLGITGLIVLAQPYFVASTVTGRSSSLRDTGLAILIGISGLRLAGGRGRHLPSVAVAFLAGIGLFLGGLLANHSSGGLAGVEISFGVIVVFAASAAVLRPQRQ